MLLLGWICYHIPLLKFHSNHPVKRCCHASIDWWKEKEATLNMSFLQSMSWMLSIYYISWTVSSLRVFFFTLVRSGRYKCLFCYHVQVPIHLEAYICKNLFFSLSHNITTSFIVLSFLTVVSKICFISSAINGWVSILTQHFWPLDWSKEMDYH